MPSYRADAGDPPEQGAIHPMTHLLTVPLPLEWEVIHHFDHPCLLAVEERSLLQEAADEDYAAGQAATMMQAAYPQQLVMGSIIIDPSRN